MWKMFLFETAASTSRRTATRATVSHSFSSPCSAHTEGEGHAASSAPGGAGGTIQSRGRGAGSVVGGAIQSAPSGPGGILSVLVQPCCITCGLERNSRVSRIRLLGSVGALSSAAGTVASLPEGEKQLRSETRSVAPARVVPSCAGATSSSVSTYASSSSALSAGSGVVRRAASRVSSRWLSAVAAAYQKFGLSAPISYDSHICDQPIDGSMATRMCPRSIPRPLEAASTSASPKM
mmetsp:Transcript_2802/g.6995  ORF Transcript_2802/g.6995 Transcript_2802/m.6995 type:complete len:236 (-) Transcript_2802:267-974(-)